jgi:RHS repeat-associated protein
MRRSRILDTACESDSAAGWYYYRARYYDPSIGRFFSEDPLGLRVGINRFQYVSRVACDLSLW